MTQKTFPIGWVLRAETTGFAVGCRVLEPETPQFGDFVKVPAGDGTHIIGIIHDVRVNDDPAVRQLILTGNLETEAIRDQRENRLVPIEVSVLVIGYQRGENFSQRLPPQPPISLDALHTCTDSEIVAFTENLTFLKYIVNAQHLPADELLLAVLTRATELRALEIRRAFLLTAGREIARLLYDDLLRVDMILQHLKDIVPQS